MSPPVVVLVTSDPGLVLDVLPANLAKKQLVNLRNSGMSLSTFGSSFIYTFLLYFLISKLPSLPPMASKPSPMQKSIMG